jgi:hypothetical protein
MGIFMGVASAEGLLIRGVGSSSYVLGHILTRGLGDLPGVMEGPPTMKAEKKGWKSFWQCTNPSESLEKVIGSNSPFEHIIHLYFMSWYRRRHLSYRAFRKSHKAWSWVGTLYWNNMKYCHLVESERQIRGMTYGVSSYMNASCGSIKQCSE